MGLFKDYVSQTRKPEGFLGKMMLRGMNSGHAKMADWGLDHLQDIDPDGIVDLGCGGGRNAGELLKRYPNAHVTAVDYSELSVEKAKESIGKRLRQEGAPCSREMYLLWSCRKKAVIWQQPSRPYISGRAFHSASPRWREC